MSFVCFCLLFFLSLFALSLVGVGITGIFWSVEVFLNSFTIFQFFVRTLLLVFNFFLDISGISEMFFQDFEINIVF